MPISNLELIHWKYFSGQDDNTLLNSPKFNRMSTYPYTRANLSMCVWPVSKCQIIDGGQKHKFLDVCVCLSISLFFFLSGPANGVKRVKPRDVSGMQRGPWYSTRNSDFFIKKVLKRKAHWIMTLQIIITVL